MFTGIALYLTDKPRAAPRLRRWRRRRGCRPNERGRTLKPAAADQPRRFQPEQKRYLEGFVAGRADCKGGERLCASGSAWQLAGCAARAERTRMLRTSRRMARVSRAGKKLSDPEKFKREEHPFDAYTRLKEQARKVEQAAQAA